MLQMEYPFEVTSSNVDEVVSLIMLPIGDISEFEDDDEPDEEVNFRPTMNPQLLPDDVATPNEDFEIENRNSLFETPDTLNATAISSSSSDSSKTTFTPTHLNEWEDTIDPRQNLQLEENLTPAQQFLKMFDDSIFQLIAEQSNTYAHQKDGFLMATSKCEIKVIWNLYANEHCKNAFKKVSANCVLNF